MASTQKNTYIIEYGPGRRYAKEFYRGMALQKSVDDLGSDQAFKRRLYQHKNGRKGFLHGKTVYRMVITSEYTEKELKQLTHEMARNRVDWAFDRPEMADKEWAQEKFDAGELLAIPRFKPFWTRCDKFDVDADGRVLTCNTGCYACHGSGGIFVGDDAIADSGTCPTCGQDLTFGCECEDADDLDTGHEEEMP